MVGRLNLITIFIGRSRMITLRGKGKNVSVLEKYYEVHNVFKSQGTVIGIYVSNTDVSISEVRIKGDQFSLCNLIHKEISKEIAQSPELLGAEIRNILKTITPTSSKVSYWMTKTIPNIIFHRLTIPEVEKDEVSDTVYWTFKKDSQFSPDNYVFDYEVCEIIPGKEVKLAVNGFAIPKTSLSEVLRVAKAAGIELEGFSLPYLTLQNFSKRGLLNDKGCPTIELYIGDEFSYITIYEDCKVSLSRLVKFGIGKVYDAIQNKNDTMTGVECIASLEKIGESHEDVSLVGTDHPQEILRLCVEQIAQKIERTLEFFSTHLHDRPFPTHIYLTGLITASPNLVARLRKRIPIEIRIVDPFKMFIDYNKAIETSIMTEGLSESCALGLASNNNSLNFLFPYNEKAKVLELLKNERRALFGFILIMIIILVSWLPVNAYFGNFETEINLKKQVISSYEPKLTYKDIERSTTNTIECLEMQKQLYKKTIPLIFMNELANINPPEIKIINISAKFKQNLIIRTSTNPVTIEGLVIGKREQLGVKLGHYMLTLEYSSLFRNVKVVRQYFETYKGKEVIHFIITSSIFVDSKLSSINKSK